ncbi:hypothetical protein BKI52_35350 [marine bacterium AO1-C]|nr:hypothetical protein BKI52_35350 [marine bacterium AO1-C]
MKSKFKIIGGAGLVLCLFMLCNVLIFLDFLNKGKVNDEDAFYILGLAILDTYLIYEIVRNFNIITLEQESIKFKHIFLRTEKVYDFNELDGFVDEDQSSSGGVYNVLYIEKNGKRIKKISSFYYSNYKEIKQFLNNKLNYLGLK